MFLSSNVCKWQKAPYIDEEEMYEIYNSLLIDGKLREYCHSCTGIFLQDKIVFKNICDSIIHFRKIVSNSDLLNSSFSMYEDKCGYTVDGLFENKEFISKLKTDCLEYLKYGKDTCFGNIKLKEFLK